MENLYERTEYIPPKIKLIDIRIQGVLCQSGEAPDLGEGWKFEM